MKISVRLLVLGLSLLALMFIGLLRRHFGDFRMKAPRTADIAAEQGSFGPKRQKNLSAQKGRASQAAKPQKLSKKESKPDSGKQEQSESPQENKKTDEKAAGNGVQTSPKKTQSSSSRPLEGPEVFMAARTDDGYEPYQSSPRSSDVYDQAPVASTSTDSLSSIDSPSSIESPSLAHDAKPSKKYSKDSNQSNEPIYYPESYYPSDYPYSSSAGIDDDNSKPEPKPVKPPKPVKKPEPKPVKPPKPVKKPEPKPVKPPKPVKKPEPKPVQKIKIPFPFMGCIPLKPPIPIPPTLPIPPIPIPPIPIPPIPIPPIPIPPIPIPPIPIPPTLPIPPIPPIPPTPPTPTPPTPDIQNNNQDATNIPPAGDPYLPLLARLGMRAPTGLALSRNFDRSVVPRSNRRPHMQQRLNRQQLPKLPSPNRPLQLFSPKRPLALPAPKHEVGVKKIAARPNPSHVLQSCQLGALQHRQSGPNVQGSEVKISRTNVNSKPNDKLVRRLYTQPRKSLGADKRLPLGQQGHGADHVPRRVLLEQNKQAYIVLPEQHKQQAPIEVTNENRALVLRNNAPKSVSFKPTNIVSRVGNPVSALGGNAGWQGFRGVRQDIMQQARNGRLNCPMPQQQAPIKVTNNRALVPAGNNASKSVSFRPANIGRVGNQFGIGSSSTNHVQPLQPFRSGIVPSALRRNWVPVFVEPGILPNLFGSGNAGRGVVSTLVDPKGVPQAIVQQAPGGWLRGFATKETLKMLGRSVAHTRGLGLVSMAVQGIGTYVLGKTGTISAFERAVEDGAKQIFLSAPNNQQKAATEISTEPQGSPAINTSTRVFVAEDPFGGYIFEDDLVENEEVTNQDEHVAESKDSPATINTSKKRVITTEDPFGGYDYWSVDDDSAEDEEVINQDEQVEKEEVPDQDEQDKSDTPTSSNVEEHLFDAFDIA